MSHDRRLWPANARVAHDSLKGQIDAPRFTAGEAVSVAVPITDFLDAKGNRDRQLVFGEGFLVLDTFGGLAFGFAERDQYVGYIAAEDLSPRRLATHRVQARATHLLRQPDATSLDAATLSFGAQLTLVGQTGRFGHLADGLFVPMVHLVPVDFHESDPVAVAERLLGTPYLWGGNSAFGIDCSGLVQACHLACGIACPGDSDLQHLHLGEPLPHDEKTRRGDLFFWKGHVGMAADSETLIHANAFHMAVAREPLEQAIDRIRARADGEVISRKRVLRPDG